MVIQDRTTRSLQEVRDPGYDEWEDDPYEASSTNVLWGRVIALGLALLFVFLIGRMSAPNGIPESQVNALRSKLTGSEQQVSSLRDQVSAAQAEATKAQQASPGPSPAATQGTTVTAQGTSYTVQSGDTLHSIADKFYGDSSLATFIAESNNLPRTTELQVDQKLTIPPKP